MDVPHSGVRALGLISALLLTGCVAGDKCLPLWVSVSPSEKWRHSGGADMTNTWSMCHPGLPSLQQALLMAHGGLPEPCNPSR